MISFDSNEEVYFFWYIEELVEAGFINRYEFHPPKRILIPAKKYSFIDTKGKKPKEVEKTFLRELSYQEDFILFWNKKAENIFFTTNKENNVFSFPFYVNKFMQSYIDVKGNFSQNDAYRRFSTDQKLVYHLMGDYIQKIIPYPAVRKGKILQPNAIFYSTFTPKKFLLTDKKKGSRKINFPFKTLEEYLKNFNL